MKITKKRIMSIILVLVIVITMMPLNAGIANAATSKIVYQYTSMIEDNGDIYYIQTIEGDDFSYCIYKLDVATGKKEKLITTKGYISRMVLYKNTLYYSTESTSGDQLYSISLKSGSKKTVTSGTLLYVDGKGIYFTVDKGDTCKLYQKSLNSNKKTLIYTTNNFFHYVKNLNNTLYFSQYNEKPSSVTLFALKSGKTKLSTLTTNKKESHSEDNSYLCVSDVVKMNGNLYYQYGDYQGSGNFWYGTLMKYNMSTKKKSMISKDTYDDKIYHNASQIFYFGMEDNEKTYIYNTKTGKTSTIQCKAGNSVTLSIVGDKTYSISNVGKKSFAISYYSTGTNKKNLKKDFIKLAYKQKSDLSYYANVEQLGDYLMIPVVCTDYNDTFYGWRGKCVGISWFVADKKGKILADFK